MKTISLKEAAKLSAKMIQDLEAAYDAAGRVVGSYGVRSWTPEEEARVNAMRQCVRWADSAERGRGDPALAVAWAKYAWAKKLPKRTPRKFPHLRWEAVS